MHGISDVNTVTLLLYNDFKKISNTDGVKNLGIALEAERYNYRVVRMNSMTNELESAFN